MTDNLTLPGKRHTCVAPHCGLSDAVSVLYLFKDAALVGTSFYEPVRPAGETLQLFVDSAASNGEALTGRYGISPGCMHASNAYFPVLAA